MRATITVLTEPADYAEVFDYPRRSILPMLRLGHGDGPLADMVVAPSETATPDQLKQLAQAATQWAQDLREYAHAQCMKADA